MQAFPATAEEFYALRDDRTNRCVEGRGYQQSHVALVLDDAWSLTASGLVMLEVTAALLARWCRQVTIVGRPSANVDLAIASMRDADPFGVFHRSNRTPQDTSLVLRIGGVGEPTDVRIDAAGWTAAFGRGDEHPRVGVETTHTLGAVAAACFGVAEVFRRAVGFAPFDGTRIFDLFTLAFTDVPSRGPEPGRHLGDVLLIGAGAVGSAMAYVVARAGFKGRFLVIDFDRVKVENFNRSPVFAVSTHNELKADAVAACLQASGSEAESFPGDWEAFVKAGRIDDYRSFTWVPVANERGVRRSVQSNLPPRSVHASTSTNWGVNFGRHLLPSDGCLLCRFPTEPLTEAVLACSTGEVPSAGQKVDAALPFVSLFAGLTIVAELARESTTDHDDSTPNFLLFDFVPPGFGVHASTRPPLLSCSCLRDRAVWAAINGMSDTVNLKDAGSLTHEGRR